MRSCSSPKPRLADTLSPITVSDRAGWKKPSIAPYRIAKWQRHFAGSFIA